MCIFTVCIQAAGSTLAALFRNFDRRQMLAVRCPTFDISQKNIGQAVGLSAIKQKGAMRMQQNQKLLFGEAEPLTLPQLPFKTYGGIRLPHLKGTAEGETELLPLPERVTIAMSQHIGTPCEPTVSVGDTVEIGQPIGESSAYMSAPIHASVSGRVSAITTLLLPNGQKTRAVEIEADGRQTMWSGIRPPVVTNARELVAAAKNCGLVGLGGAGFPTHVKLNLPEDKKIDTLLLCGAECEPYLTSDYREMIEGADDILEGVRIIRELLGIDRAIIGVEANKPEAIRLLSEKIAENGEDDTTCVLKLRERYPQGAEKVLVQAVTGRRVPKGKLPTDVGVLAINVTTVAVLARYLRDGVPLVNKRVTVEGTAIVEPKNVIAPIGTPLADIIEYCGGLKTEPRKLIMGGPMMGFTLYDESFPLLKQNNGFVVMAGEDVDESHSTSCIRCGRCMNVCPMHLRPAQMQHLVENGDAAELSAVSVMSCVECGSCAYVCPAQRRLVQYMRMGKNIVRKAGEGK